MTTPHTLAEKRMEITGLYSRDSEKLEEVLAQKPKIWMDMRKVNKTNTETDRAWEANEMGIKEMRLRLRLRRYEKQLSALRSMLEVKAQEARNII